MPMYTFYGALRDLSIWRSAVELDPTTFGKRLAHDTVLPDGANVATVATVALGQVIPVQNGDRPGDDRALVAAAVGAMAVRANAGGVAYVVTTAAIAKRLGALLDGNVAQYVVRAVVPTSPLQIRNKWVVATEKLGFQELERLVTTPRASGGQLPEGAWIEVDRLVLPPALRADGVSVWHVQAQWALRSQTGVLQMDGLLVFRNGRVVAAADGYRGGAVARWLTDDGATTFELPPALAVTKLTRLVEASPAAASSPTSMRPRPAEPADGYAALRGLLWEDLRLLPRAVSTHLATGAVDFWSTVIGALPGLQALLTLPREVLEASVRRRCTAPTAATDVLLSLMDVRVLVAALTLGGKLELSRSGKRDVVSGGGCTAVFDAAGRLVGGTSDSSGISDGELAAWRRVPPSAQRLIDGGAAVDPSEAFLLIAGEVDAESLRRALVRRNVVEHLRVWLRGQRPIQGPRHRVLVTSVADPRRAGRASAGAVALMHLIAEAGFVVVSHERDVPVGGFAAWPAGEPVDVTVVYHGAVEVGMPTRDSSSRTIRVAAHAAVMEPLGPEQLVIAWCAALTFERTASRNRLGDWYGVVDVAFDPERTRRVWPLRNGRFATVPGGRPGA